MLIYHFQHPPVSFSWQWELGLGPTTEHESSPSCRRSQPAAAELLWDQLQETTQRSAEFCRRIPLQPGNSGNNSLWVGGQDWCRHVSLVYLNIEETLTAFMSRAGGSTKEPPRLSIMKEVTQKVTRSWRRERTISIFWRLLNLSSQSPTNIYYTDQRKLQDGG